MNNAQPLIFFRSKQRKRLPGISYILPNKKRDLQLGSLIRKRMLRWGPRGFFSKDFFVLTVAGPAFEGRLKLVYYMWNQYLFYCYWINWEIRKSKLHFFIRSLILTTTRSKENSDGSRFHTWQLAVLPLIVVLFTKLFNSVMLMSNSCW